MVARSLNLVQVTQTLNRCHLPSASQALFLSISHSLPFQTQPGGACCVAGDGVSSLFC